MISEKSGGQTSWQDRARALHGEDVAYEEQRKTIAITVRVTPGFARALRTYVRIMSREGHAITVASFIRRQTHGAMSRRLHLMWQELKGSEGEKDARLQAEAKALAGYTLAELG